MRPPGSSTRTHSANTSCSNSRYSRYDAGTPSRSSSSSYCLPAKYGGEVTTSATEPSASVCMSRASPHTSGSVTGVGETTVSSSSAGRLEAPVEAGRRATRGRPPRSSTSSSGPWSNGVAQRHRRARPTCGKATDRWHARAMAYRRRPAAPVQTMRASPASTAAAADGTIRPRRHLSAASAPETTSTWNVAVAVLPDGSVAVQVTVVIPAANVDPDAERAGSR